MGVYLHETSLVESNVNIGDGVKVWANAHIRENVTLGENVIVGEGVYIGPGVHIGRDTKIQNGAMLYEPAYIDRGVFIGPQVVFTNDHIPRAIQPNLKQKTSQDWKISAVRVASGASIGANSVCVAPVDIGRWAMVGAGSVVTKKVPDFAMVVGVPARLIGWICKCGLRLPVQFQKHCCPSCGENFEMINDYVKEVALP